MVEVLFAKLSDIPTIGEDVQAFDAELAALAGLVSAADRLPYFTALGAAALATFTTAGRALVDDTNSAAQRTTLGLEIGVDVQAFDAELAALASLVSAADRVPYFTGSGAAALATFTSAGRALIDDANTAAQRTTLGLVIGTDIQAFDAELAAIAGLTSAADALPYFTGSGAAAVTTLTTFIRTLLDDANATAALVTLGLVIGTDVQAFDADTLKADTADTLTAGFNATENDAGTKTTGTFTPDPAAGNFQKAVNGGAHTLAPPGTTCSIVIQYTNNASAGAVTTSGFTIVDGNTISTVNGDDFLFYITRVNGFSHLHVKALQ